MRPELASGLTVFGAAATVIYAGTRPIIVKETQMNKVYEIRDREDFTEVRRSPVGATTTHLAD